MKSKFINIVSSFVIIESEGSRFYFDDMFRFLKEECYDFSDLKPDDVFLDVGACIGTVSLKVHKKVKKVYALEPIMVEHLSRNIKLNQAKNIEVIRGALSENSIETIRWAGRKSICPGYSLSKLLQMCGGRVDFLKIDCEGAEWNIKPEELKNIRRVEGEVHNFDGRHNFNEFLLTLHLAGFKYDYEIPHQTIMYIHARR
jgi:hypothetical protein